ncbi:probable leucine-rich repeat receptor-like protein kinase At1g35710 [Tripterygium wilfordii]|uniref:probable leucine-rich repeat receptor-like protein kinase At1g35710 n=1 Tax=Tripterygium wilfordii TaxID=458696 RepID=UPI0018F808EB|nr:probable leucine-rich repeat receptor-like protein kinase At1g35710 [Tripterygium wilfordii]
MGVGGPIPFFIFNMSSLTTIYLEGNDLFGSLPKDTCQHLPLLNLGQNKLIGGIPKSVGNGTLLKGSYLAPNYLKGNPLNDILPSYIGDFSTALEDVVLEHCELEGGIPIKLFPTTLWSLTYILEIYLNLNSFIVSLSSEIRSLKVLTRIGLSGTQLSGNMPSSIGGLQDLRYLSLVENDLIWGSPIPESLGSMTSLVTLNLSSNNLSGVIPKSVEELSCLSSFNVSFSKL